jgi:hypothetical protein
MAQANDEPLQLSVNDTASTSTLAVQRPDVLSAVLLLPQLEITGSSSSLMVTVKLHWAVRLTASVTTMVTVVSPLLNVWVPGCPFPLSMLTPVVLHAILAPGQLSPKTMVGMLTEAVHSPASLLCEILLGQVMLGFSESVTVTLNEHVAVFAGRAPSVTVTKTAVSPLLNTAPANVEAMVPLVAPLNA